MSSKKKKNKKQHWTWWLFDKLFPNFTELQFIIIVSIIATLIVVDKSVFDNFIYIIAEDIRNLVFPISTATLTYYVFKKYKFGNYGKSMMNISYNVFIAVMSYFAFINFASRANLIDQINFVIICTLFGLAVTRLVIMRITARTQFFYNVINKNLSDYQYHPSVLLATAVFSFLVVNIIRSWYQDPAIIAAISFTYITVAVSFIEVYIKKQKSYK